MVSDQPSNSQYTGTRPPIRVLLIESSSEDVALLRRSISAAPGGPFEVEHVENPQAAVERLAAGSFDVVLLDPASSGSEGLAAADRLRHAAPHVPVILLSGNADYNTAVRAVQGGAQDYIFKDTLTPGLLGRSMQYAIDRKGVEQQTQERSRQLEIIYNLTNSVSRAAALEDIYSQAIDGLMAALGADRASVLLFDPDDVMRFKAWRGLSDHYRSATEGHSPWRSDAKDPQPLLIPDVAQADDLGSLREIILGEGIRSIAFIPLVYQDRLLGKFMIYYNTPRVLREDEVQLARAIASNIAFAIGRKRIEEAVQRGRRLLDEIVDSVPGVVWEAWGEPDDAGQTMNFVSSYVETMLGYSVEEWLATPNFWLTIVHPEDRERAAAEAAQKFAGAKRNSSRFRWIAKDGRALWVEARSTPILDPEGRPVGMRGVTMDISDRVAADEERHKLLLSEQEARAEAEEAGLHMTALAGALDRALAEAELLNSISTAAAGEDDLSRILTAALEQLSKVIRFSGGSIAMVEGDELVIRAAYGVFSESALGQRLERGNKSSWQVVDEQRPFFSNDLVTDGLRPLSPVRSYLAVPLTWRGKAFGLLEIDSTEPGAFTEADVTLLTRVAAAVSGPVELALRYRNEVQALAQAEAARARFAIIAGASSVLAGSLDFKTTLSNVTKLIVPHLADLCVVDVLDESGNIKRIASSVSDPAKQALVDELQTLHPPQPGSSHPVAVVFRTAQPVLVPHTDDAFLREIATTERHYEVMRDLGYRSLMAVPLITETGVSHTLYYVYFETGRSYTEDDLALAEELAHRASLAVDHARLYSEAQQAVHAREELLSIVSHDLKNPLGTIKGFAQLLQRRVDRSDIAEKTWLLDGLSRIDATASKMNMLINELLDFARLQVGQPLDLYYTPSDIVVLTRQVAAEFQQTTDIHNIAVDAAEPAVPGEFDVSRLERAITNIVSNAIKYSPQGGEIQLTVRCEGKGSEGWTVLEVRDPGIGIPDADLPHIFEWFRRAGNTTGQVSGTGIGLASARQVVEQHGGSITASSREGEGSTFTIRLPLYPPLRTSPLQHLPEDTTSAGI